MFVTVVTPIILAGYVALGAASALGGGVVTWLFHRLLVKRKLDSLEPRITGLEK